MHNILHQIKYGINLMLSDLKRYSYLLIFLLFLPVAASAFDNFDCVGTESFWKLSISKQNFTFTQKTAPIITMPAVEPTSAENMNMDHIRIFRTKLNNKEVIIIIQKQSCTDGKSEDVFAYEGLFISSDKVFHGCCSKKLLLTH